MYGLYATCCVSEFLSVKLRHDQIFAGYTHSGILYIKGVPLNVTIMRYIEPSCKGSSSQEVLCLKVTLNTFPEAVVSVPLRIMPPLGRVTSLLAETFKGYNSLLEQ